MKILLICLLFLAACKNHPPPANKIIEAKDVFTSMKDPFLNFIPDSLKHFIPIFDSVFVQDQLYRSLNDESLLLKNKTQQHRLDSINQVIVFNFLDTYGYPSMKQVGLKGVTAINAVIQHSPIRSQEKYFPVIVQAYKDKKLNGESLAMLEDRINIRNKRRQYYGTQVAQVIKTKKYTLYPVHNIDSVNIYRKNIGALMPIEQYLKNFFHTDWDFKMYEKYKKAVELQFKINDSPSLHIPINGL